MNAVSQVTSRLRNRFSVRPPAWLRLPSLRESLRCDFHTMSAGGSPQSTPESVAIRTAAASKGHSNVTVGSAKR